MGAANTGGTGDSKSVTKKKAEKDTEVSAYEKELAKQEAEKKAEANVEMGLGTPSTNIIDGTLSDPREKDDTAAIQSIKDSKKTTTTNIGNGGNDGGNNNTPAPIIIKKTVGGQTIQTTAPTEAELSQSAAADAEEYDLRKTKKRGRSMMLLTGPQGLSKDDKLTLGKPSLLGS
jgi:hypothetical protein